MSVQYVPEYHSKALRSTTRSVYFHVRNCVQVFFIKCKVLLNSSKELTLIIRSGDFIITSGDLIIRSGDLIIRSGDLIIRSGDLIIRSGDLIIRSGALTIRSGDL